MHPLIPLALSLTPELAGVVFGKDSGAIAGAVVGEVQAVTGTADPEAARGALSRDAAASESLKLSLKRIAANAVSASTVAPLAGGDALPATQAAIRTVSGAAWGAPVISVAVLATFAGVLWAAMTRALPPGAETMVNLLMGSLAAMASSVVAYWVGSSAGSAAKTNMLFHSQPVPLPAAQGNSLSAAGTQPGG